MEAQPPTRSHMDLQEVLVLIRLPRFLERLQVLFKRHILDFPWVFDIGNLAATEAEVPLKNRDYRKDYEKDYQWRSWSQLLPELG